MPKSADSILSFVDGNGRPLPGDLLRKIYSRQLALNGYVKLVNVPDDFDYVGFLGEFGDFLPGPGGEVVADLIPERGTDDSYHSGNRAALVPHTEAYDLNDLPPRYLALWCLVPASGGGGETTLFDGYRILETLTAEERVFLESHHYQWTLAEGLRKQGMFYQAEHPVIESVDEVLLLRFSYNNLDRPEDDTLISDFLERGKRLFDEHHFAIDYQPGEMLHWDNWRMLHARNAFSDYGRRLKRVQIRHKANP